MIVLFIIKIVFSSINEDIISFGSSTVILLHTQKWNKTGKGVRYAMKAKAAHNKGETIAPLKLIFDNDRMWVTII